MDPRKIIAELKSVLQVYIEDNDGPADAQKRRAAMAVRHATAYLSEPEKLLPLVNRRDDLLICTIADRAGKAGDRFWGASRRAIQMALTKCHRNGCPLDLELLAASSNADFINDVAGILENMSRRTGQLVGDFRPKFAKPAN